jgi:MFS transporter, putative metabolite:H+ symporter
MTAAESLDDLPMGPYQWRLFWLAGFGWAFDMTAVAAVGVLIKQNSGLYGLPEADSGLYSTALYGGMFAGAECWGRVCDRRGRRPAFIGTLLTSALFFCATACAGGSWLWLGAGLFGVGLGAGGGLVTRGTLLVEWVPQARRGQLVGALGVFWPVGGTAAAAITWALPASVGVGWCDEAGGGCGWRLLFALLGVLCAAFGALSWACLPESARWLQLHGFAAEARQLVRRCERQAVAALRDGGGGRSGWCSCCFLRGQGGGGGGGGSSSGGSGGGGGGKLGGGAPLLAAGGAGDFDDDDEAAREGQLDEAEATGGGDDDDDDDDDVSAGSCADLFHASVRRSTVCLWVVWSMFSFGAAAFYTLLPKLLSDAGFADGEADIIYLVSNLGGIPGALLSSYVIESSWGRRRTLVATLWASAAALLTMNLFEGQAAIAAACFMQQLVQMAVWAVMFAYTPEVYPTSIRARGLGAANMLDRIGGMIGPFVGGVLLAESRSVALAAFAAALGIAAVASLFLRTETKGAALAETLAE